MLNGFKEVFLKTAFPIYVATENPPDFFERPHAISVEEE